ncbi:hypothetical protein [Oceanospirillum maris]|uniref:hypothetical protein n=1 Tax=Oceanospirillum maris TaxID=64977 RepID=UPI000411B7D9|nr:hypothetical protein [Oceanospirillum maris]
MIIKTTMKTMMRTPMTTITPMKTISNAQPLPEHLSLSSLHQDRYHVVSELAG